VNVGGQPVQNGLTAKLERLLERTQNETDPTKKKKLLALLYERVEYVHDRQRLQRIDYGAPEGRVSRQVALTEALAQSMTYLAEDTLAEEAVTRIRQFGAGSDKRMTGAARVKQSLDRAQEAIIAARKKGRRSDLVRSAGIAASFSIAGALFADHLQGGGVSHETSGAGLDHTDASGLAGAASADVHAPYTVKQGDTLWDILSQKTDLSELGETRARENAVANIIKTLKPADLQEIGITSGDVRLIHPGDTINMEKLSSLLHEHHDLIENARVRYGHLPIDTDLADIIPAEPLK
jgi:hypothetical protein